MRTKFPIQLAKEHIILAAYSEAIDLLRPEAEKGHPEAQFLYGFLKILNPSLSPTDSYDLIRQAAEQGHANAHYVLATVHDFASEYQFEMPRTEEQWQHLEVAVQQGSIPATVQMAKAYRDGIFVQKDLRRARKLLKSVTCDKFPLYADAYYEHALLLLDQREPGQKQRAATARHLIFAIIYAHNSDVIRKARCLMAETIRDPRYQFSRKEALERLRHMKQEHAWRDPGPSRLQWQYFLDDYCRRTLVYDLREASFEEFVSLLFDHPLREDEGRWEKNWEFIASVKMNYRLMAQYYTRLFQEPTFLLDHYTPEEIDQGWWFVMGNVGRVLAHQSVSVEEVEACFRAMYDLFAKLFILPQVAEISNAAHMWWDSRYYEADRYAYDRVIKNEYRHDDEATIQHFRGVILDVLARTLQLDSIACKAHALHGLGHLHHPSKEQVIRNFLANNPDLPDFENWYQYGMAAIEGKVM
jgi:TPR repeat protein